jgi:hypothetical protein
MKRCFLTLALLVAVSLGAKASPSYDGFIIRPEDTIKMGPVALDHRFEVTLNVGKARELLEFTRKHVGKTVAFCWMESNQSTHSETIYLNAFTVESPIRDGILRLEWPHTNWKTDQLFVAG